MPLKEFLRGLRIKFLTTTRYKLKSVGKGFNLGRGVSIRRNCLSVGDYVYMGNYCHIATQATIGNFVMFASFVSIIGGDHRFDLAGAPIIFSGRDINKEVQIGDDVWIGHGTIILHGVTVGEGAVIGAGSIITHDVEPYTVVVGNPPRMLRKRFDPEEEMKHREMLARYRATKQRDNTWRFV